VRGFQPLKIIHNKMHRNSITAILAIILFFGLSLIHQAVGQDKGLDINIDLSPNPAWYEQTWLLVAAGAAVFILILVAILKNNGKKLG
jgi:divalent metal cation (Fe/Co/Zn/Cd) transporter